jgi:hypothetical protein
MGVTVLNARTRVHTTELMPAARTVPSSSSLSMSTLRNLTAGWANDNRSYTGAIRLPALLGATHRPQRSSAPGESPRRHMCTRPRPLQATSLHHAVRHV